MIIYFFLNELKKKQNFSVFLIDENMCLHFFGPQAKQNGICTMFLISSNLEIVTAETKSRVQHPKN